MSDEAKVAAAIERALRDTEEPRLPERLSAGQLWQAAEARRRPRIVAVRSHVQTGWGEPPSLGLLVRAAAP